MFTIFGVTACFRLGVMLKMQRSDFMKVAKVHNYACDKFKHPGSCYHAAAHITNGQGNVL